MQIVAAKSIRFAVLASQFCFAVFYSSALLSNSAPDFPAIPEQTLVVNERYQMLLKTVDNHGVKVGIVSVDLPDGAEISDGPNETRVLDWLPGAEQTGTHNATIIVFNADAINARQRIELQFNVLSHSPAAGLNLPEFAAPVDQAAVRLIPAAAKALYIPKVDHTQLVESEVVEPEAVVRFNSGPATIRGSHFLPTYLTDPTYKIGDSR